MSNFSPMIVSIANQRYFKMRNRGSIDRIFYFESLDEEYTYDLIQELMLSFREKLGEFDNSMPFNSWIKLMLSWKAINFRLSLNKQKSREVCSLNDTISSDQSGEKEDGNSSSFSDNIPNESGLWSNRKLTDFEKICDNEFEELIKKFIYQKYSKFEYDVFCKFFFDEKSLSEIAIEYEKTYHSNFSTLVSKIKLDLVEYLSSVDHRIRKIVKEKRKEINIFQDVEVEDIDLNKDIYEIDEKEIFREIEEIDNGI